MEAVTEFLISVFYGVGFVFIITTLFFIIISIFASVEWLLTHHPVVVWLLLFIPFSIIFLWWAGESIRGKI